jgi:hypothetical protein
MAIQADRDKMDYDGEITGLLCVPPYDGLGLIGELLSAMIYGKHVFAVTPMAFMKKPSLPFSTISK